MDKEPIDDDVLEATIAFLDSIKNQSTNLIMHFDTQTNILIGIGTAVAAISISNLGNENSFWIFTILGIFSALSVIVGLYAIRPPKTMRKQGQRESLFYNKKIASYSTSKEYAQELKHTLNDRDELINQYSAEVYNVYKYYYRPKRTLFNISRNLLVLGIVLSLITLVIKIF